MGPYADLRYRKKPLEKKVRCLPEVTSFLEEVYETEAECLPENVEGVDAPWKMTPRVMALTCMRWALVAVHQARAGEKKNGTSLLVLCRTCGVPSALGIRLWPAPASTSTGSSRKTGKTA